MNESIHMQPGVEIYPGFSASDFIYENGDQVQGIVTRDIGFAKDGSKRPNFEYGAELRGKVTLLAEGCRGSLAEVGRSAHIYIYISMYMCMCFGMSLYFLL